MFVLILDLVEDFHTVEERRLHRIFCGLLKNTYRVNGILYSLKQVPLLKRLLPATLYQIRGFKIFANVLSVIWELVTIFLFKFIYFAERMPE